MCRGLTVIKLTKMPECKRCGRQPSIMGKEPMYLAPYGSEYFVLCGSCSEKLMEQFGNRTSLDLMNLYTHAEGFHQYMGEFLRM